MGQENPRDMFDMHRRTRTASGDFVVILEKLLGVVVGVDAGLSVVEVGWWDPFGVAVGVFAGGPALFGELVVGAAAERHVVDVGDGVGGVAVAVMGFA